MEYNKLAAFSLVLFALFGFAIADRLPSVSPVPDEPIIAEPPSLNPVPEDPIIAEPPPSLNPVPEGNPLIFDTGGSYALSVDGIAFDPNAPLYTGSRNVMVSMKVESAAGAILVPAISFNHNFDQSSLNLSSLIITTDSNKRAYLSVSGLNIDEQEEVTYYIPRILDSGFVCAKPSGSARFSQYCLEEGEYFACGYKDSEEAGTCQKYEEDKTLFAVTSKPNLALEEIAPANQLLYSSANSPEFNYIVYTDGSEVPSGTYFSGLKTFTLYSREAHLPVAEIEHDFTYHRGALDISTFFAEYGEPEGKGGNVLVGGLSYGSPTYIYSNIQSNAICVSSSPYMEKVQSVSPLCNGEREFALQCGAQFGCTKVETASLEGKPIILHRIMLYNGNTYMSFVQRTMQQNHNILAPKFDEPRTGVSGMTVNGQTPSPLGYTGVQTVAFTGAGNLPVLEFAYNFSSGTANFSALNVTRQANNSTSGYTIVRGLNLNGATKTVYVNRLTGASNVCIKDADVASITEVSSACTGASEYLIPCSTSGTTTGAYTCQIVNSGAKFKVGGLSHSAILEMAPPASPPPACTGCACTGSCGGTPYQPRATQTSPSGGSSTTQQTTTNPESVVTTVSPSNPTPFNPGSQVNIAPAEQQNPYANFRSSRGSLQSAATTQLAAGEGAPAVAEQQSFVAQITNALGGANNATLLVGAIATVGTILVGSAAVVLFASRKKKGL